jgi:hypothetical protein
MWELLLDTFDGMGTEDDGIKVGADGCTIKCLHSEVRWDCRGSTSIRLA